MRHRTPSIAALVSNRYAEQYLNFSKIVLERSNQEAIDFLAMEAGKKIELMDEKWDELRKWRQENDLISLQAQQDFIQEKRKGVSASLTAAEHSQLSI